MSKRIFTSGACALLFALCLHSNLAAQPAAPAQSIADAVKFCNDMAVGIAHGSESPANALVRLRAQATPSGLKIEAEADFGFAAVDVAQRLLAVDKPAEAELFFRAAEKSLILALKKTPDTGIFKRDRSEIIDITLLV